MKEPRWLTEQEVNQFHKMQIEEHGGLSGIRDQGLLDSALAKPKQLFTYSNADIFELAAAYAFGIIKNHAFLDGNKRTGIITAAVFLMLNGYNLNASEEDLYLTTVRLADGSLSEQEFANWLKIHSEQE